MRNNIVNEQQPFGKVFDTPMLPTTLRTPLGASNRPGATETNGNNGRTVVESFADKNPGAYEQACRGRDNPFGPVGKNFGVGITNKTENYSNGI